VSGGRLSCKSIVPERINEGMDEMAHRIYNSRESKRGRGKDAILQIQIKGASSDGFGVGMGQYKKEFLSPGRHKTFRSCAKDSHNKEP